MSLNFYDDGNGCRPTVKITDTGSMSTYQKLCYVLDLNQDVIEFVNTFQETIDAKEDSVNITNQRKLSPTGDFTGTIQGKNSLLVLAEIDDNGDKIEFITEQFEDGATGIVIDCGFFEDNEVQNNYNGGAW